MTASAPLQGVRVVDVTTTMLGPYASLRLAEMGADVIKIEAPIGDITRHGPGGRIEWSGGFLNTNAGKRSLMLDLKQDLAREAIYRLSASANVFIHNMPRPTADRLGIGPDVIRGISPSIVYCAAYGFGEGGPYAGRPAYDDIVQAASGIAASQHPSHDGRPSYISSPIADKTVGLMAAFAISSALVQQARDGIGCEIEVPMFEVMSSYALQERLGGAAFIPPRGPITSKMVSAFRRPYRTSDGYIAVLLLTQSQWETFADLIGQPELLEREEFVDTHSRLKHRDFVFQYLDEVFQYETTDVWVDRLLAARLPAGPLQTLDDLLDDEHLAAVDFFQYIDHPAVGKIRRPRSGVRIDGGYHDLSPAPSLGQHNEEILADLEFDASEIHQLLKGIP